MKNIRRELVDLRWENDESIWYTYNFGRRDDIGYDRIWELTNRGKQMGLCHGPAWKISWIMLHGFTTMLLADEVMHNMKATTFQ